MWREAFCYTKQFILFSTNVIILRIGEIIEIYPGGRYG